MIQNDDIVVIKDIVEIAHQEEQLNTSIDSWIKYNKSHHRKIFWKFTFEEVSNDKSTKNTLLFYPEGNFSNIDKRFRNHVKFHIQKLCDRITERELDIKIKFITA